MVTSTKLHAQNVFNLDSLIITSVIEQFSICNNEDTVENRLYIFYSNKFKINNDSILEIGDCKIELKKNSGNVNYSNQYFLFNDVSEDSIGNLTLQIYFKEGYSSYYDGEVIFRLSGGAYYLFDSRFMHGIQ